MINAACIGLGIIALTVLCKTAIAGSDGQHVSIINLISSPQQYDSQVVFLSGYLQIGLENNSLCFSKYSLSTKDCVWIEIDSGPFESKADYERFEAKRGVWERFNGQVVSVRGTFDSANLGHMGMWSGAIHSVTDIFGEGRNYFFIEHKQE